MLFALTLPAVLSTLFATGAVDAPPHATTAPDNEEAQNPWRLQVGHPSLDRDGLYQCVLRLSKDTPMNTLVGFVLVLIDREERKLGVIPLGQGSLIEGDRWVECRLSSELVKNSYILFQLHPNTPEVRFVQAHPGAEQTIRKVHDTIVREPIR